jgi:tetratricopeptide (TPR) repeat protein
LVLERFKTFINSNVGGKLTLIQVAYNSFQLKTMEPKDYIAIGAAVISSCSFVVSYITWRQKSAETQRTMRNQVTETIAKLDTVFAEWDKLNYENTEKRNDPYFVGRRSFLNGQKRFIAKHALYLMEQIPELITDFEYSRVADAFNSIGDFEQANKLYKKAIDTAESDYYKSICTRGYGRSLFAQGLIEKGRSQFKDAVSLVSANNDVNRFHTAETYQRWAVAEADAQNLDEAKEKLNKARDIYLTINSTRQKDDGLANLKEIENRIFPNPPKPTNGNIEQSK